MEKVTLPLYHYIQASTMMPVSRSISNRILAFPIYPDLTREEQKLIISTIKSMDV